MYIVQLHFWPALGSLNSLWHRLSEKKVSFLAPKDLSRAGLQPKKPAPAKKNPASGGSGKIKVRLRNIAL